MSLRSELSPQLQKLGLNKNESAVYLDLLGRDLTNVGPIVQSTKLHRQQVYEALARLQEYGLVTEAVRDGRKHFQASKPQRFMHLAQEQMSVAEELIPKLAALEKTGLDRMEVRVVYGKQEYFEICAEMLENAAANNIDLKIMGGAPESIFYDTLGPVLFERYMKILNRRKVGIKMISPSTYSKSIRDGFVKFPRHELRISETGLSSPTFTRLTSEMTSIEIFSPEVVVLAIRSRAIARTYLEHFDRLWLDAVPHKVK